MEIQTKFSYGDKCYLLSNEKIRNGKVIKLTTTTDMGGESLKHQATTTVIYTVGILCDNGAIGSVVDRNENALFATKEELMNSLLTD